MTLHTGLLRSFWGNVVLLLTLSTMRSAAEDLAVDRQYQSSTCVARQHCTAKAAIISLMNIGKTAEEAKNITDYTHGTSGIMWNTCSCSATCTLSGNCCPDAQGEALESLSKYTSCDFFEWSVLPVVDTCPGDVDNAVSPAIISLCQAGSTKGKMLVKMTNIKTFVTYSNLYCGMCHGVSMRDLLPWSFKLHCTDIPFNPNFIFVSPQTTPQTTKNRTLGDLVVNNDCIPEVNARQVPPVELTDKVSSIYGAALSSTAIPKVMCEVLANVTDTCPPGTPSAISDLCTEGMVSYVVTEDEPLVVYKNAECALCNSIPNETIKCQICDPDTGCMKGDESSKGNFILGFSVLVQPYSSNAVMACQAEKDGTACQGELATVPTCNLGEYLDTSTVRCVPICPAGTFLFKGICINRENMSTSNCDQTVTYDSYISIGTENNITESRSNNDAYYMELSSGAAVCHSCSILAAFSPTDGATTYENGSININSTLVHSLFVREETNATFLCLPSSDPIPTTTTCPPGTCYKEIQKYEDYLTVAFCIISICFLLLFFAAFCVIKRMRNIPGCTIAGNMLMFLLAYITFLARGLNAYWQNDMACKVMAVLVNYFFIAAFVFMIIYAVLIIRSLEFVDLDSRYTPVTVAKIWIGGLGLPFVTIIPALLLDEYIPTCKYSPGYGGKNCFMSHREGNILFFTVPIAVCLLISLSIYVVIVHRLRQIAAATSRVRQSHREKVYLCFKLIVVLGFNWISALLAAAVDREKYPVASKILSTIFVVLCCLHGFFGFIVFVASGSNIQNIKAKYHKLKDSSASSTSNTGVKATRTYSVPANTSTVASELSTMIRKTSPKSTPTGSPLPAAKFDNDHANPKDYNSMNDMISPNVDSGLGVEEKHMSESPVSTRSNCSKHKCDFF